MSIIKIEFNEDDAITQKYFGEALVNMAYHREHGKPREVVSFEQQIGRASRGDTTVTTTTPTVEPVAAPTVTNDEPAVQLPWDERIHSGNKTQNQDGSWKMRKKPKDMTAEQWQEYIESVEAELTTLMSIPVEESVVVPETVVEDVEIQQVDVTVSQPETTATTPPPVEQPVVVVPKPQDVTPPPPPVTDVVPAGNTQGVVEVASSMTFVQLVQKMSGVCNGDSEKSTRIKESIKEKYGVDFPALLKRPDLIPQVAAFLETVEV